MKVHAFLATLLLASPLLARPWTEAASGRKIEAEYVSADAQSVTLSVKGGKTFKIELARLSAEDKAFVRQKLSAVRATPAAKATRIEDRFEDIQIKAAGDISVSGEAHPALGSVDDAVRAFMAEKGIGAVTFALSKDGKLLHDRAFGWADADLKTPLQPGVKMRVASMTKPVVMAAIKTLFDAGKLKPEDIAFKVLDLGQYKESKGCDERWQKVTVQHLLDHKGGWDRDVSGDFTSDREIPEMFRVKTEDQTPEHVMRYGLTKRLDFDPGERYAYCNYGYILLVRIIEKVSGQKFMDYLHATVCKEAKTLSFSLSSTDARDRQSGETWYCYAPEYPRKTVPLPFRTEARDGAGILACTAADYCRFLESYSVIGNARRPGGRYRGAFSGSHPGVSAICSQREDGINYAIICNRREGSKSEWNEELRKAVDAALAKVAADMK
ncbi:MAG: serine hydrolase domain-containing protein [Prosthecobacter sp.]